MAPETSSPHRIHDHERIEVIISFVLPIRYWFAAVSGVDLNNGR